MHHSIWNIRIIFTFILIVYFIPYLATLPLDLIDIDSSQYGEIVREMAESKEYTKIMDNGRKYLDKPILTFWIVLPFFKLIGPENYAFRLPYLIFLTVSILALFHTVLLITKNEIQAWIASILYISMPGVYNMVLDPKIDLFLTSFLIFTHYFYFLGKLKNPNYFYLMYISIGLGFITKGPISLVIPCISIGGDLLMRRDWELLKKMRPIHGIFLVIFFPALWSYFLYQEFSSYGPTFFLWIQSFGRFYKDLYNTGLNPLYFYMTFLWSSGIIGLVCIIIGIYYVHQFFINKKYRLTNFNLIPKKTTILEIWKSLKDPNKNFVFLFWLFLYLFLISFSRYQLPQYVFWCLPAAAIFFSNFLFNNQYKPIQYLFIGIPIFIYIAIVLFLFVFFGFSQALWQLIYPTIGLMVVFLLYYKGKEYIQGSWILGFSTFLIPFLTISLSIYPSILQFQPSKEIGKIIQEKEPNKNILYTYRVSNSLRSFAFYSRRIFRNIYDKNKFLQTLIIEKKRLIVVPEEYYLEMQTYLGENLRYEILLKKPFAKIAIPKKELFVASKRDSILKYYLLVEVSL